MNALIRIVLVGIVVPLLIAAAGVTAILIALPDLPDPIAVHWGGSGGPDGTGPVWLPLVFSGAIPLAFAGLVAWKARPGADGSLTTNQRIVAAASPFLAAVLVVTMAGSVLLQRGLASALDAPDVGGVLALAFASGAALGIGAWFVLPRSVAAPSGPAVQAMPLSATGKAVWMRRVGPARGPVLVLSVAAALVAVAAVIMWVRAPLALAIGFTAAMTLVVLLAAGTLAWRVTVGADGLRVRSAMGVPSFRVPLDDIEQVSNVSVDPVRDFGGWGIRWGERRRWGVVVRRGEAIEVRRTDGSRFAVTVPGAGEGASLLAALAARD